MTIDEGWEIIEPAKIMFWQRVYFYFPENAGSGTVLPARSSFTAGHG